MYRRWTGVLAAICLFGGASAFSRSDCADCVATESGLVESVRDSDSVVYKGVPFAAPPIGDLRWRAPQRPVPWEGVLRANAFKPMCMSAMPAIPGGAMEPVSEDCLYLNIWTPLERPKAKLPVMVWIYGGGFRAGSASSPAYWGNKLVEKGVITVNLSYRVGSFGFLSHPDLSRESGHGTSGNYGILDMIAALQWVQRNIAAFGGDPGNVTIFGQSAGSFGVGYLMASPLAHGLFQRAIGESGADMGPIGPIGEGLLRPKDAEASGVRWAKSLEAETIAQLRQVPAEKLLAIDSTWPADASGKVKDDGQSGTDAVLDGYVFPQPMYETFAAGKQNDVPILIGYNANEGGDILFSPLSSVAYRDGVGAEYAGLSARILDLYPAGSDEEAARSQLALLRDSWFGWHMWSWARLQSRTGRCPVYFYKFAYIPQYPPGSPLAAMGAAHGFELGYVFAHKPAHASAKDEQMLDSISTYWTNFAKSGDPNAPSLARWPAFTSAHPMVMTLGDPISAQEMAPEDLRRLELLDMFYAKQRGD